MGSKREKRKKKRREWDDAAETLGLSVTKRSLLGLGPTRLEGAIGRYAVLVSYSHEEHAGESTTYVVGMPPGPWDDHKITIKKRGRLRRTARIETGDSVFDDKYTVQLRKKTSPTTRAWIVLFLTPARRLALLDLQNRLGPVRLTTGLRRLRILSWAAALAPVECHSALLHESGVRASGNSVATSVRALVACAEVLVEGTSSAESRVVGDGPGVGGSERSVGVGRTPHGMGRARGTEASNDEEEQDLLGVADVRAVFRAPRFGFVAACYVTEGEIQRNARVRLVRDGVVVYDGRIALLRRFKDDVASVAAGFECGIGLETFRDIEEGDTIESYEVNEVTRT